MNVVEFTHFSCYYKRKNELTKALDDLSFSVAEGELFVVVGESGCGKTTLLKSVMGLSEYLEGELIVDGTSVDSLDIRHSNMDGFLISARALIKNPSILLLDEPFSNADPKLRTELRCLLRSIHQQLQTTMLFVTHDLGEAFSLADRMLVLEQGHIADIGSPVELLRNHRSALLEDYLK